MAEVDSAEFNRWMAYAQIERFGPPWEDIRLGTVAAAIYNVQRDTKAHPEPFGASDVFSWMDRPEKAEPILLADPKEHAQLLRMQLFGSRLKSADAGGPRGKSAN
jgi:hypothetical protein